MHAVQCKTNASCSRDYAALIYLHRCEACSSVVEYVILCGHESCVSYTDKSLKLSEAEVCKSFTVHWATSLNASRSSIITRGWISCLSRQKIIALKVLRSSMKNVKKKSSVQICWLWATAHCTSHMGEGIPWFVSLDSAITYHKWCRGGGGKRAEVQMDPWGTPLSKV